MNDFNRYTNEMNKYLCEDCFHLFLEEKEEAKPSFNAMPIYSDEELEEFDNEEEEENNYDDDIDYSDYDKYYEEQVTL